MSSPMSHPLGFESGWGAQQPFAAPNPRHLPPLQPPQPLQPLQPLQHSIDLRDQSASSDAARHWGLDAGGDIDEADMFGREMRQVNAGDAGWNGGERENLPNREGAGAPLPPMALDSDIDDLLEELSNM